MSSVPSTVSPAADDAESGWVFVARAIWPPSLLALVCWYASTQSYLTFHSLTELFSILVALSAAVVASGSPRLLRSQFVPYVSLAIGWCAVIDLVHMLVFKGMQLLATDSANPATQLWIAARGLQAVALVLAPAMLTRVVPLAWLHGLFGAVALGLIGLVAVGAFPVAYVDGQGLTPFKVNAEYVIIGVLLLALWRFWRHRSQMTQRLWLAMSMALLTMVLSEFAFTRYVGVYAGANLIGHLLKIYAYWFVFTALVQHTLREPFDLLQTEVTLRRRLAEEREQLVIQLDERIKELRCLNDVSELAQRPGLTMAALLQGVVERLPAAFERPQQARAALRSSWGHHGAAAAPVPPTYCLSEPIRVAGSQVGVLDVWYESHGDDAGKPFLAEEQNMLQNVALRVGEAIGRMQASERIQRLQYLYEMLSRTNRTVTQGTSRDELLEAFFQLLSRQGTFQMAFMAETEDGTWPLRLRNHHGIPAEYIDKVRQVLSSAASPIVPMLDRLQRGDVVAAPMPVAVAGDGFALDSWLGYQITAGVTERALVPLMCHGQLRALVGLYARGVSVLDADHLRLLREMADDVGMALDRLASQQWHQQTEAQARLLEHRFQEMFRMSPVPMQIHSLDDHRMLAINEAHQRWLGYELGEISNQDDWFRLAYRDPALRERLQADWAQGIERAIHLGESVRSPELTLHCKDGSSRSAYGTMSVVGRDALIAWTDLTEIRRGEQALRESERRFRGMVEQTLSGMYVRRDGRYIYVNPRYCEIVGWTEQELLDQPTLQFVVADADNVERIRHAWDELHSGGPAQVSYTAQMRRRDGQVVELGLTAKIIRWDDGLPATIVMAQDITERKRAQERIDAYVRQLEHSMRGTLQAVSNMVEIRDPYTAGHERRVGLIASAIAHEMGWSDERCTSLELLGLVHDIGKIAIPSEILTKPTRLSPLETELMRTHAEAGYEILKDVPFDTPVAEIIRQHHERMDGSGYPRGLKGEHILPEARVLAVADVLESMASHRPYRPAVGLDAALQEVIGKRGQLYASEVVDAVLRLVNDKGYVLPT